jgi:hypothetical protein
MVAIPISSNALRAIAADAPGFKRSAPVGDILIPISDEQAKLGEELVKAIRDGLRSVDKR